MLRGQWPYSMLFVLCAWHDKEVFVNGFNDWLERQFIDYVLLCSIIIEKIRHVHEKNMKDTSEKWMKINRRRLHKLLFRLPGAFVFESKKVRKNFPFLIPDLQAV